MHRRIPLVIVALLWLSGWGFVLQSATAQSLTCTSFDAWVWAQSYFAKHPDNAAALDPEGNGLACDELRGIEGFSPALWTEAVPSGLQTATFTRQVDGDSFYAIVNGVEEEIRLYRSDAPEAGPPEECGSNEATLKFKELLGYNDFGATFSIEHDKTVRDQYGRLLVYMWVAIDGQPYLVNEAMVRSGWSEDKDYGDRLYGPQMQEAAAFAKQFGIGAYGLCGPLGPAAGAPPPQVQPTPAAQVPPAEPPPGNCDPSYPEFCLAPSWEIGDLDCGDIPYTHFTVYPPDSHNFDGNFDGEGCEGP
jgi:endonuclease YncB( thermonuclease family)